MSRRRIEHSHPRQKIVEEALAQAGKK